MKLKHFPESAPLTIHSRRLFALAYRNFPVPVSDLSFGVLYAWQEYFGYRISCHGDFLLTHYRDGDRTVFLPPLLLSGTMTGPGWPAAFTGLMEYLVARCRENGTEPLFCNFPGTYLRHVPKGRFTIIPERDSYDYIYSRKDLVELPGQKYSAKRNLIKQFTRTYAHRYEVLGAFNPARVEEFIRRRREAGAAESAGISAGEPRMLERLLSGYSLLKLCGGVLLVNDAVVAVTIGTIIPDFLYEDGRYPTVVVHAENALVGYKGAYQMINRLFSAHLPEEVVYINREEDLGIAGLRKAKLSYHPARMIEKCRLELA